jgi:hypothetical protein
MPSGLSWDPTVMTNQLMAIDGRGNRMRMIISHNLRQTYDHLLLGTDHRYTMIMDLGANLKTKPHRHRPCLVLEAWEFTCQVGIGQKMHTAIYSKFAFSFFRMLMILRFEGTSF